MTVLVHLSFHSDRLVQLLRTAERQYSLSEPVPELPLPIDVMQQYNTGTAATTIIARADIIIGFINSDLLTVPLQRQHCCNIVPEMSYLNTFHCAFRSLRRRIYSIWLKDMRQGLLFVVCSYLLPSVRRLRVSASATAPFRVQLIRAQMRRTCM